MDLVASTENIGHSYSQRGSRDDFDDDQEKEHESQEDEFPDEITHEGNKVQSYKKRMKRVIAAKKRVQHAYIKKPVKRLNQADKTKGLKYQAVHKFVQEVVQRRWKSGLPITKSEVHIQSMRKFSAGDFFKNVLDKAGKTNHFYLF